MHESRIDREMGSSIQTIANNSFRRNSSVLLNVKLFKLRDFHASFKSICDSFSIDLTEFEHIFGAGEPDFVIWDSDNNGLIDSLELFSGISLFSDTKFQDKVRFLFDIFDFNEVEVLSKLDVEFLMYCCVSSSFKIFSIVGEIDSQEIGHFVGQCFGGVERITVAHLIRMSKGNESVKRFMAVTRDNKEKERQRQKEKEKQKQKQKEKEKQKQKQKDRSNGRTSNV